MPRKQAACECAKSSTSPRPTPKFLEGVRPGHASGRVGRRSDRRRAGLPRDPGLRLHLLMISRASPLWPLLCAAVAVLVHWRALDNGFALDDVRIVEVLGQGDNIISMHTRSFIDKPTAHTGAPGTMLGRGCVSGTEAQPARTRKRDFLVHQSQQCFARIHQSI